MAVANIGTLLARGGAKVLLIDFDLEAPGLDRYFGDHGLVASKLAGGVLDVLEGAREPSKLSWRDYRISLEIAGLDLLPSGRREDPDYSRRVLSFDWGRFYAEQGGGDFIERLREEWREEYDFVLVDSRTGFTDVGGVCTVQLPDILVLVFTATAQSLEGAAEVARRAREARQSLVYGRMELLVYPLPSRFDGRVEHEEARAWLGRFANELEELVADWLPKSVGRERLFEQNKLPHVPFYSFGEKLPVLDNTSDPEGLGRAYEISADLIRSDFSNAVELFGDTDRSSPVPIYDIFVSYPTRLEEIVSTVVDELRDNGLRVFWADDGVQLGDPMRDTLKQAQLNASMTLLFLDVDASELSQWQELEMRRASSLLSHKQIPVFVGRPSSVGNFGADIWDTAGLDLRGAPGHAWGRLIVGEVLKLFANTLRLRRRVDDA